MAFVRCPRPATTFARPPPGCNWPTTTTSFTATRVDFQARWKDDPVKATAIQAIDAQRSIYLLDGPGKRVVQLTRDGTEVARFALPPNLDPPTAFYVSEGSRTIFTIHGSKIVATELRA